AGLFDDVDLSSGEFPASRDDFTNTRAATGPQIVEFTFGCAQSENMCARQIDDVNIVANTGAVRSFIIVAVNFRVPFLIERDLKHVWDQVRLDPVIFAETPRCTGRIEITEGNELQTMNLAVPTQNLFIGQLGFAIRIDWARRRSFVDWHALRWSENRARRRKHDPLYPRCHHGIEQVQTVRNVVAKIFGRIAH